MSIAVEFERFILTAILLRERILDAIASERNLVLPAFLSGGDS
jgi:hypothetical protein